MAKSLDLVGKRFGNLVVIERAENNHRGNTQWKCKCDCGGTKTVLGYDLTHGRTTTCGCRQYLVGKPSRKRIDLVGRRFGKLTVVSLNEEKSEKGVLVWNCLCDCGNTFVARGGNLKSGKATHCGCSPSEHSHNFQDLTGRKFGRLTVEREAGKSGGKVFWQCVCECGNRKNISGNDLRSGHTKSCGCLSAESRARERERDLVYDRRSRLYREYTAMKNRCRPDYCGAKYYYDRGIRVCYEWKRFEPFQDWALANGYADNLTLDRINVNAGYSPDNCRWVTIKVQQNNKRDNVYVTINGETKTLKMWCEQLCVDYRMVLTRRRRGWPQERWFEPPRK